MTNNAEDKMKAGARAVANKIANAPNDLKAEYYKKKRKEDAKDAVSGNLDDSEGSVNTVTAAAKAVANKVKDAGRDLDTQHEKEKAKETFD